MNLGFIGLGIMGAPMAVHLELYFVKSLESFGTLTICMARRAAARAAA